MGGKQRGGKKKCPESAIRMNFLHQAAACVLKTTGNKVLTSALGHHLLQVGQKSQIRLGRDIKRTLCKGCHGLLVPDLTASIKIIGPKKQKKISILCSTCCTEKSFLMEEKKAQKPRIKREKIPGKSIKQ